MQFDRAITELGREHRAAAVATLAAAFQDDPALAWLIPDAAARPARLRAFMALVFDEHLRFGRILGTPGCEVVTLWRPPGSVHRHQSVWDPGALRYLPVFRFRLPQALATDAAIRRHLPPDEQWLYLKYAAVRPDCQGKGLGGLAIRDGLAEAARLGVPSVLETATESNLALYRNLGYQVVSDWQVDAASPRFWTMHHPVPEATG
jgi:ribosomal protein S18 acetylase RimI-like enzyme